MKRVTVTYGGCCDAAEVTLNVTDDQLALLHKLEQAGDDQLDEHGDHVCASMTVKEQS